MTMRFFSAVTLLSTAMISTLAFAQGTYVGDHIEETFSDVQSMNESAESQMNSQRIIGGTTAGQAFPWMVALVSKGKESAHRRQFCGGTLIGSRWVLTAAHCLEPMKASEMSAIIGVYNLKSDAEVQGNEFDVSKFYIHPQYRKLNSASGTASRNDIALIELKTAASGREAVSLITADVFDALKAQAASASPQGGHALSLGAELTVMGWGTRKLIPIVSDFPQKLRKVNVSLVSQKDCKKIYGDVGAAFCATATKKGDHKGACSGDSGGPIFWRGQGQWLQVGIVSFGRVIPCGDSSSGGVYADVAELAPFIEKAMSGEITGKIQGSEYKKSGSSANSFLNNTEGGALSLFWVLMMSMSLVGVRKRAQ